MLEDELIVEEKPTSSSILQADTILHEKEHSIFTDDILKPLKQIDGYFASAIFDNTGKLVANHNDSIQKTELINTHAETMNMVTALAKAIPGSQHDDECELIQITANTETFGKVSTLWAIADNTVTAVLLKSNSNIGLARIILTNIDENIKNKLL